MEGRVFKKERGGEGEEWGRGKEKDIFCRVKYLEVGVCTVLEHVCSLLPMVLVYWGERNGEESHVDL